MGLGKVSRWSGTGLGLRGRGSRSRLLSKALAEAFAILLACGSLKTTELGLGAACDTGGVKEVGDTEVEKDGKVRSNRLARTRGLRCRTCSDRVSELSTCTRAGA